MNIENKIEIIKILILLIIGYIIIMALLSKENVTIIKEVCCNCINCFGVITIK